MTRTPHEPEKERARSAVESARDAGRAIRDLIEVTAPGGDPALRDPAVLHLTLDELVLLGHRLPQALHQLTAALHQQHDSGHLAIEDGTEVAGDPGRAVSTATAFLDVSEQLEAGEQLAEQLGATLDRASRALAHTRAADPKLE